LSAERPGALLLMPKVGQSMEEGTVVEWHVADGEEVTYGQVVATIETDKATYELEAPAAGSLKILVPEGEEVPVETPLAAIGDVDLPAGKGTPSAAAVAGGPQAEPAMSPGRGAALASPRAKRLAAEHGIGLSALVPSSSDGVISVADVERAIAERQTQPAKAELPARADEGRTVRERRKLTGVKRTTARRTQEAWTTIPHIVQMVTVDVSGLLGEHRRLNASGVGPSLNEILLHLAARVMAQHPELNATVENDELLLYEGVDVGFAVDAPRGLVVPVLRGAAAMSLEQLVTESRRLIEAARGSGLKPEDVGRASLTVSNLGMFGVRTGTPVINLGEPILIFVGAIEERPAVVDGAIVARPLLDLSVAYDHRVADGVQAARFTRDLVQAIEAVADAPSSSAASLPRRELTGSSPGDAYVVNVDASRGRKFTIDEPSDEGGADQGPSPVDMFLGALLACLTISLKATARRRKVPLDRVEGRVKANERGHIKQIRLELEVWSSAPEPDVRALLERAERGCYVSALLRPDLDYQLDLVVHSA
jgi:pyruvate/2-oxoglutarate dehydrogenase complex dihydrolipoamide acyltransferase (E2) component/uncharacterized OsmC-like protein